MIYKKDNSVNIFASIFVYSIIFLIIFGVLYNNDYANCYKKAKFFKTNIKEYNFIKRKCIIELNNKKYNLNFIDKKKK